MIPTEPPYPIPPEGERALSALIECVLIVRERRRKRALAEQEQKNEAQSLAESAPTTAECSDVPLLL